MQHSEHSNDQQPPEGGTSIIIPCYNYGRFLPDAIESALAQTRAAQEVIVVDDGSTDGSEKIASRYPVLLITQMNRGLSSARNLGIEHSTGSFVLPLDADDKIHPEFLERTVPILERQPNIDIVFTHRQHFGMLDTVKEAPPFDLARMLIKCSLNYCSLYRKSLWTECGGYDETMRDGYEDWDFWLSAADIGRSFHLLPEVLFFYRKHGPSLSDIAKAKHEENMLRLKQNHPDLYRSQVASRK